MTFAPTIIAVHGVGLCPALFAAVPFRHPTVTVVRPGYEDVASTNGFDEQVEFISALLQEHSPAVLVGVSGGATIALACATRSTPGLVAAISHEPLVGALASELDDRVRAAGERLADSPSVEAAIEFVRGLYGSASWDALDQHTRLWAEHHAHTICHEVSQFASYQPSNEELSSLTVPHLTTVGATSSPVRQDICRLLEQHGSSAASINGSGHLVLTEQPVRFANIVDDFIQQISSEAPFATNPALGTPQ